MPLISVTSVDDIPLDGSEMVLVISILFSFNSDVWCMMYDDELNTEVVSVKNIELLFSVTSDVVNGEE